MSTRLACSCVDTFRKKIPTAFYQRGTVEFGWTLTNQRMILH